MQAPKEFEGFYKDGLAARLKDNRLANVTVSWSPFDKLDAADASVDVVTWFQGPHELYCAKACGNAAMGDPAKSFAEVARILKPGGTFVIMDHVATAGAPTTSGNDLHRIDPMPVKALATTAGFGLDEETLLPSGRPQQGVFDPSIGARQTSSCCATSRITGLVIFTRRGSHAVRAHVGRATRNPSHSWQRCSPSAAPRCQACRRCRSDCQNTVA
jgi:hypothetical protein